MIKKVKHTLFRLLFSDLNENISDENKTHEEKRVPFYRNLIPEEGNYVVPVIIGINILVFIAMLFSGAGIMSPDGETLVKWGANYRPLTLNGEWWRLITSNYIHIGIIHLAFNMYALSFIGKFLEPFLGKTRLIIVYTATGIIGSAASVWWNESAASAGASGAIFGVHGVFLAMLTGNFFPPEIKKALLTNLLVFIGLNLMIGVGAGFDNAGHIGGVVSGVIFGYVFLQGIKKENKTWKWISISIVCIATVLVSILALRTANNDLAVYGEKMEEFSKLEQEALSIDFNSKSISKDSMLLLINTKGLDSWKRCKAILDETDGLKLPDRVEEKRTLLKSYCALRIRWFELAYLAINNDTTAYDKELESLNLKIKMVLKELNGE